MMNHLPRRLYTIVPVALLLLGLFGFALYSDAKGVIPDDARQSLSFLHKIKLIDQNGRRIKADDLREKVVMINFFFTACGNACPVQTAVLRDIQSNVENNADAIFISISIAPLADSVTGVREYIEKYKVDHDNWFFAKASVNDTQKLMNIFGVTVDGMVEDSDQIDHRNTGYLFSRQGALMQQYPLVPATVKRISKEMKILFELKLASSALTGEGAAR